LGSVQNPEQDPHVVAVARPQVFAFFALAEPVSEEDFRRVLDFGAHGEPMTEIIGHVVTAERKHGHGVPTNNAHVAALLGRGGFRRHGRAHEHAVLPVEAFGDEGR